MFTLCGWRGPESAATRFVIKPRPDRRRHLRTWTSGRTLARVSVPRRVRWGPRDYSSPSFAIVLRWWEPSADSAVPPGQSSAPLPASALLQETIIAPTSFLSVASEHASSLQAAGLGPFPHSESVTQQSVSPPRRCLLSVPWSRRSYSSSESGKFGLASPRWLAAECAPAAGTEGGWGCGGGWAVNGLGRSIPAVSNPVSLEALLTLGVVPRALSPHWRIRGPLKFPCLVL